MTKEQRDKLIRLMQKINNTAFASGIAYHSSSAKEANKKAKKAFRDYVEKLYSEANHEQV